MKLVFFGTPDYSLLVLEPLAKVHEIAAVVTKPMRPVGRKKIMTPTPVALWAQSHHIPLLTPETHPQKPWDYADSEQFINEVLAFNADLLVVADYSQLIPWELIEKTRFGGLNVHPSWLPNYRGPAPVPWAIYHGETETGVSIITLAQAFDSGSIVAQEKEPIFPTDTTHTLLTRLFVKGADLLIRSIPIYTKDPSRYSLPPHSDGSYTPRLSRDLGFESWETIVEAMMSGTNAQKIERKWRAFHPWPGLWTRVTLGAHQEKRLKIVNLSLSDLSDTPKLVLDEIQLEGKAPVTGKAIQDLLAKVQPPNSKKSS